MSTLRIVGRSSSLFTRLALIFAEELGVPVELVPIHDMTSQWRARCKVRLSRGR